MLPRRTGFSVRIIAPLGYRIDRVVARRGVSTREARSYIERMDKQRNEFLQKYFHHDVANPHVHDLVINIEQLGAENALDLLLAGVRSWLKTRSPDTCASLSTF